MNECWSRRRRQHLVQIQFFIQFVCLFAALFPLNFLREEYWVSSRTMPNGSVGVFNGLLSLAGACGLLDVEKSMCLFCIALIQLVVLMKWRTWVLNKDAQNYKLSLRSLQLLVNKDLVCLTMPFSFSFFFSLLLFLFLLVECVRGAWVVLLISGENWYPNNGITTDVTLPFFCCNFTLITAAPPVLMISFKKFSDKFL